MRITKYIFKTISNEHYKNSCNDTRKISRILTKNNHINFKMRLASVEIHNFRGISYSKILFNGHNVIIGDNNAGKSTIFEAIDLVLGPDRLNRVPVIDEHDFFNGNYMPTEKSKNEIRIEVILIDLENEQKRRFNANLEFWDVENNRLLVEGEIGEIDNPNILEALRVSFIGKYDAEEDDFVGETFYSSSETPDGTYSKFNKSDKRECGFLYLRALRTGSRALSMERGSLLDIILRIKELRPKMWETLLNELRQIKVAADPQIGISEVLSNVQDALKEFVPADWGEAPTLKVSDLTREHLRKTLTIFLATGKSGYHAPFHHQGTGTVNTMVLALLSMIAESKKTVIFAMEEPEIAIPPYTQKRIIHYIRQKSTQAIFTSHSPFVLEEFAPQQIVLLKRDNKGEQKSTFISFPKHVKPKNYNSQFRMGFAEALLAKRVLITEGSTEAILYPAIARKLSELEPEKYLSLEAMGIAIFNAESENSIPLFGELFKELGKDVFAVFDKQQTENLKKIKAHVWMPYEIDYKGIEDLLLAETAEKLLLEFYQQLEKDEQIPTHLGPVVDSNDIEEAKRFLDKFLKWTKAGKDSSELIALCTEESQIPVSIRKILINIKDILEIM
ncbi:putative ATP-dependent endonuclease of OLD family [Chryseobacterium rhizosphaerae]|uniref:ATP-dependent nuclease n=1 Tax=Chryseobacterium rhizosphaerae TaxID=395937 RepID=UPI002860A314|nr:AAA family ATPase [Chryseobacterium rhizosphaerae]MDR6546754.1 putative ATP-dependent endonuclease of OLD family [Chryseobacterium rhizosphaerae]